MKIAGFIIAGNKVAEIPKGYEGDITVLWEDGSSEEFAFYRWDGSHGSEWKSKTRNQKILGGN